MTRTYKIWLWTKCEQPEVVATFNDTFAAWAAFEELERKPHKGKVYTLERFCEGKADRLATSC